MFWCGSVLAVVLIYYVEAVHLQGGVGYNPHAVLQRTNLPIGRDTFSLRTVTTIVLVPCIHRLRLTVAATMLRLRASLQLRR